MRWWRRLVAREQQEQALDAELRDHLERLAADYVREGLDLAEARRRARLAFGGLDQVKEDCRDARGTRWAEDLARDLGQAARLLVRHRRFSATATLAIALGVGANATFFSLVHEVLLRALPYREPDRLVALSQWHPQRGRYGKVSGADFQEWSARATGLEELACYWDRAYTLTGAPPAESLVGWQFSGNLFALLGASPLLGRVLGPEDARPGAENVAVIAESLWRRRFAGDPAMVGRVIALDGVPHTVVGVMPRRFAHPDGRTDLWTPLVLAPDLLADRARHPLRVVARLRTGVTRDQAQEQMARLGAALAAERPESNAGWSIEVKAIRELYVGDLRPLLLLLQAAVLLLLLIACANVASLVLARALAREREIAMRLALGARAAHLVRQFLVEGLLLAAAGGLAGLALAAAAVQVVPLWLGEQFRHLPTPESVAGWLSPAVLGAVAAATVALGVGLGLAPLARGVHLAHRSLKTEGRGSSVGARAQRWRQAFVVTQVALSVCLLVGALLLVRSFARLQQRALGFATEHVLTGIVTLPAHRYAGLETSAPFLQMLAERLQATPGVESAGLVSTLPLTGMNARRPYQAPGRPDRDQVADFRVATPGYFPALGIPLRQGRLFDERDRAGTEPVVLVNETLARRLWLDRDAVGQILLVSDFATPRGHRVVGVVGGTRHDGVAAEPQPEVYRPASQAWWPFFGIAVRTRPGVALGADALQAPVAALDRDLPVTDVRWMHDRALASTAWRRSSTRLLGVFAGAALLLAVFGLYALVSYAVAQGRHDIGVRLALGAAPSGVAREFALRGLLLAGAGIAAGLAGSALLARTLEGLLFGIAPLDAVAYAAAGGFTLLVTVVATSSAARAAAAVDPMVVLRAD
jgi:putative ABC transport system permease protein